ncbi:30S ribosomal protein S12 methylthiotransferase RimO [bacterium]|nr:30S ribosomal protein S12 methylthiotransferase RimO [bacterium]
MKVGMISLGCSKNQIDSEMILGLLTKDNFTITQYQEEADLIIINTCGFIDSAKNEALEEISRVISEKRSNQKLVVCGCLAQRYKDFLEYNFKDIDLVISINEYPKFGELISHLFAYDNTNESLSFHSRILISSKHAPYVRIADGCNNHCAFCAIPLIRGKYISREMEDILDEVKGLVNNGAKEINLIAQDTSKYGVDNYHKLMLPSLLKEITKIDGIFMIRIFYIYPESITDELIDVIKNNKNIAPYFDIPLQHASNKILKYMNRHSTKESSTLIISKIRKEIPNAVIRTTLMVGFPYETKKDFDELIDFVKEMRFFHMGAFMYSREEDTPSYDMKHRVPKFVSKKRYSILMETQEKIALEEKKKLIGNVYEALVDSYESDSFTYSLRNYMFAPDDVDSSIIATCPFENDIKLGDIVKVKIIDATAYELFGEIVEV